MIENSYTISHGHERIGVSTSTKSVQMTFYDVDGEGHTTTISYSKDILKELAEVLNRVCSDAGDKKP